MKKIFNTIIVVLTVLLISCGSEKDTPKQQDTTSNTKEMKTEASNKNVTEKKEEAFDFKIKLQKGDKYSISVTNDEKISNDNGTQKATAEQTNFINYDFNVSDIDEFGNYIINVKIRHIKKGLEISNGQKVEFNSKSEKKEDETPDITSLRSLIGKGYTLTLTPDGKVIDVKGAENIINSVVEEVGADEKTNKALKIALSQEFSATSITRYYERIFNYIDGNQHKLNSKWQKVYDINIGVPLKVISNYTLKNVSDDKLTVTMVAKLKNIAGKRKEEIQNIIVTSDINGNQSGTIIINRKTGFLVHSVINQKINAYETRTMKDDKSKSETLKTSKSAKYIFDVKKK